MVFSSEIFLALFLPITLVGYYLIRQLFPARITAANVWLFFASIFFYAWGEPVYVVLMLLSILANFLFGRWVSFYPKSSKGKQIVALACVFNLGLLFVFKYLGWILGLTVRSYHGVFSRLPLPIGISFYTFQALSYVIDVYRKKCSAQKNLLTVGLYIAFFPQLIAGPIVKYNTIAEQLDSRKHTMECFSEGVWRFVIGLAKKVLLANELASVADWAFAHAGTDLTVVMAWAGAIAFTLQLYFDFSGYSDMAIGLGRMFGFTFNENFNYPFVAASVSEYWRRWHISLGEWFREYLFYPLSLGTGLKIRKAAAAKFSRKTAGMMSSAFVFFVTWMATGIWHGANTTFVLWGFLQFVSLFWEQFRKPLKHPAAERVLGHLRAMAVCVGGMILFNSASVAGCLAYYADMFGLSGHAFVDHVTLYWLGQYDRILIAALIFAFPVIPWLDRKCGGNAACRSLWDGVKTVSMLLLLFICLANTISGGYNPFMYFNF